MRFICNFLPLLKSSPYARVVSVLAGGLEGKIFPSDLELKTHYGVINCANVASTYNTLFMERMAKENPSVGFVHEYPGFVATPLVVKGGSFGPFMRFFMSWIFVPICRPFFMLESEEAGERGLFHLTSSRYGPVEKPGGIQGSDGVVGSGCYILNWNGEPRSSEKVLKPIREKGWDKKIWDYTLGEFDRVAAL
jgi:hypothetical protein